ncbi:rhodanese-related sulfurtransferase [Parasphingopyxis algicola]|uniref:oxygen-dependent tRNA uridine(34) hydroxylase TrhO n=1 Tax=Parasphingopyxis algicola TaxID=2026624 RepID=UPI0015A20DB3|nr:rhodanese-related sulfurtransferase [Parasphingopyxis algicola]QLC25442.1 rhodanese-related sulfurtransferase [Parasphingopyxis algicola]
MTTTRPDICVAALYRFTQLDDLEKVRGTLLEQCRDAGTKGTILLAPEGINGTIAGTDEAIVAVLAHIRALPGCADLGVKFARAAEMPFYRMKVRIKREIVTMGEPDIDPVRDVGDYVAPEDWNVLISDPDTILIDTRNDYEVAAGTFENAIDPKTPSFRDFPAWFRENREALLDGRENPRIAMFCTGGIRCEKATALLKAEGLEEVFHLKGGILKYLETVDPADSRWIGECFVFDERVTITHGLERGSHVLCRACRMPVSPAKQGSPFYVEGVSCPACYDTRTEEQRRGYAERQRQSEIAAARGEAHVGAELSSRD